MGLFFTSKPAVVKEVAVICGMAGEDWLYRVRLDPLGPVDKLPKLPIEVIEFGRGLKVPRAGTLVDLSAANFKWNRPAIKDPDGGREYREFEGLSRIKAPKGTEMLAHGPSIIFSVTDKLVDGQPTTSGF